MDGVQTHLVHYAEDSLDDALFDALVDVVVLVYNAELAQVDTGWTDPVQGRVREVL
jgi:hypothetical protein